MHARLLLGGRELRVDLSQPVALAVPLDFRGPQPRHFGAPRASSEPLALGDFTGAVDSGASCNCAVITLVPHCNGTHTECVGHLTREPLDAYAVTPPGLVPAILVSVAAEPAGAAREGSDPPPQHTDRLITRRALERAWQRAPYEPRALILRTLPNPQSKKTRDYTGQTPPYLSREAAQFLVERGILHLVVDLPSVDRERDDGRLTAHRLLFGLPPGATALAAASRPDATITELAYVPDELSDGAYLLELQVPALCGDAVPSRPLAYRLTGIAP